MCLPAIPVAVAYAAVAMSVASAAVSAVGAIQQGNTADKIAQRNATLEEQRGEYEARQIERRVRFTQGRATAQAGANGIGLSGSFLDILADNAIQGEVDAENARRNAGNTAGSIRADGAARKSSSRFSAVGSIIQGVSSAANIYNSASSYGGGFGAKIGSSTSKVAA